MLWSDMNPNMALVSCNIPQMYLNMIVVTIQAFIWPLLDLWVRGPGIEQRIVSSRRRGFHHVSQMVMLAASDIGDSSIALL